MKGTILNVTETEVLIRCNEGNKHAAPLSEIKSTDVKPRVGDDVDFETADGKVTDVYILRAASKVENFTHNASAKAADALAAVKGKITEEDKEKLRQLSASAKDNAVKLGGELKGKAGTLINNLKSGQGVQGVNASSLKALPNKFALIALSLFLIFSFTEIADLRFARLSYYDMVESYILAVFLVASLIVAGLGLSALIYRVVVGVTLFIAVKPLYDFYDGASELGRLAKSEFGFRMPGIGDLFAEFSTPWIMGILLGFVLTAVSLIPGMYKARA
jgi:hypothetical protein